ncbi:MAG TPA: GNAT family N-acetyltransferase [Burkholderiales bacterium]|nr:GNAT family N-acetyltransferase [Burkholderiales bacterium]
MTDKPRTYTVNLYTDLAALPDRYERLFTQAGAESLFHTLPWYRNFLQSGIVPAGNLRIFAVEAAGNPPAPRAVLAMCREDTGANPFRPRTLGSLSNYYSCLFGPVLEPGIPDLQETLEALARAIANDESGRDVVNLNPLARDEKVFPGLVAALGKAGLLVQTYFCFGNWYLEVNNQPFGEYLKTRTSRLSKTGKRQRRILESGTRFRYELFSSADGLERGMADYNTVYNSSWKVPEPYPDFLSGLMRTCAAQGWLRLGIAYMDGVPAAAQIWMVVDGTASIYKMAYDERYAKDSIGTVLSSLLMEHVIDRDKVKVVDYLSGDDAYKRDWMSTRRERWGIMAFNPRTLRGGLAAARHLGARAAKQTLAAIRNLRRSQT